VFGTNIVEETMGDADLISGYSQQHTVERGVRFLGEPFFSRLPYLRKKHPE
jgi:hypothetical protein